MERFDYIRFVYETAEAVLSNSGGNYEPSIPTLGGGVDAADLENLPGGTASKPGSNMTPATPENTTGKDKDKLLFGGTNIVDPCWVLNSYGGPVIHKDTEGNDTIITGTIPLTRGPYARVASSFGHIAQYGSYDWYVDGFAIWLEMVDGTKECLTLGGTSASCWPGGSALNKACTNPFLGGTSASIPPLATLWDRFAACMLTKFPECEV